MNNTSPLLNAELTELLLPDAYRIPPYEVVARLRTDATSGLAANDAVQRLAQFGRNELVAAPPAPRWRKFLAQFENSLVVLLLIATLISFAVWLIERESQWPFEAIAILAIVLLNAILGYIQEARAERAVAALRALAASTATVLRDGQRVQIAATELAPGDILLIEEGDTIAADARLLVSTSLQTAEAALTGESQPISKSTAAIEDNVQIGDRTNMVFSGTAATFGRGRAVVTATGMHSEMGKIAGLLQETEREATPLQVQIDRLGRTLGQAVIAIAVVMVITIIAVSGVRSIEALVDMLILGVSLAVAAVPEGLATTLTIVLALGVRRMAARHAIVKKLAAVETLGSATTIASDKTGTLTKNEMTVRAIITAHGRCDFTGSGYNPLGNLLHKGNALEDGPLQFEVRRALRAATLANNATLHEVNGTWTIQGDPTEGSLLVAGCKANLTRAELDARFERVTEMPFSSERKLMSTVHADTTEKRYMIFAKGAPDVLLGRCTYERVGEELRPLTDARRAEILAGVEQLAAEALRTLGIGAADSLVSAAVPPDHATPEEVQAQIQAPEDVERDLAFLGVVGIMDPPRPEAADSVAKAKQAGLRVLMVTGDHPATAAAIAGEIGIIAPGERAITGAELEAASDAELLALVRQHSVYARVSPQHKLRIIHALRADDQVVAMTGDGVNDAPALKQADIGVAMGVTGTDVAKEAADMILTDDNFASIVAAVEEGRAIFANIRKFLRYLLSSNIGEVLTMFLGVVFAGVIGLVAGVGEAFVFPLLATQILWINLATDAAPALALGIDPAEPGVMRQKPRLRTSRVIDTPMWINIVIIGVVMAIGTLAVLDLSLPGGLIAGNGSITYARTMTFTTLVFFQLFNVFNARSDETSAFKGLFSNIWLWAAVGLSVFLQILVVYVPVLQQGFATTPLTMRDWLICTAVASLVLWTSEIRKLVAKTVGG